MTFQGNSTISAPIYYFHYNQTTVGRYFLILFKTTTSQFSFRLCKSLAQLHTTFQINHRKFIQTLHNIKVKCGQTLDILPREVPTKIAVGVARPRAQGQETT